MNGRYENTLHRANSTLLTLKQKSKTIGRPEKLLDFLKHIVPTQIPDNRRLQCKPITSREAFLSDVEEGLKAAPMSFRMTPHVIAVANWAAPLDDPIVRQFVPMKSSMLPDHPMLELDSLHEMKDPPVEGLVHRYPDKVLFLGVCEQEIHLAGNLRILTSRTQQHPSAQCTVGSVPAHMLSVLPLTP